MPPRVCGRHTGHHARVSARGARDPRLASGRGPHGRLAGGHRTERQRREVLLMADERPAGASGHHARSADPVGAGVQAARGGATLGPRKRHRTGAPGAIRARGGHPATGRMFADVPHAGSGHWDAGPRQGNVRGGASARRLPGCGAAGAGRGPRVVGTHTHLTREGGVMGRPGAGAPGLAGVAPPVFESPVAGPPGTHARGRAGAGPGNIGGNRPPAGGQGL